MIYTDLAILFLLYAFPLYLANATPIVLHGKRPLDFNLKLFNKPLLGKGKTILGTISGITAGTLIGVIIYLIFPSTVATLVPSVNYVILSLTLALGAILGDILKSFFKRRFGIRSGEQWVLADQLDFIIGGLVLTAFLVQVPDILLTVILLITTFFIHSGANYLAFKLKLKKVPW